jgi:hypothetical protein
VSEPDTHLNLKLWAALVVFLTLGQIAATALVPRSLPLTLINDAMQFVLMFGVLAVLLTDHAWKIAELLWIPRDLRSRSVVE